MSTRLHILPNEIKQLQEEAVRRATDSVGGPVGLYEEWPDDTPTLIVTEDTGKRGLNFCRAVWEDKDAKANCILDHQYRAHITSDPPISECWLGVHNAVCHLIDNASRITLLGGAFHVSELKKNAYLKLESYVEQIPDARKNQLVALWHSIPELSSEYVANITVRELELVATWYSFVINELSRFRYEESHASHDLLIFLQSLIGNLETLAIDLKRAYKIEKKMENRFEEIIKQCVTYSDYLGTRLGNLGDPEFSYYPIELVVKSCSELYRSKASRKWVKIVFSLDEIEDVSGKFGTPKIRMDREYINRALHNVLDNAIKYSIPGTPEQSRNIEIVGEFKSKFGRDGYIIKVSNLGIGVEENELESVFKAGYQGRLRAGEMRKGFGIGLPVVKECVELHGGEVSIESRHLDEGQYWFTTLSIWLPLDGPENIAKE